MLDFARLITWLIITLVAVIIGGHQEQRSVLPPPCTCTSDSYNCDDFATHAAAQTCFDHCYPDHGDIHRLDRDHDSLACESLP